MAKENRFASSSVLENSFQQSQSEKKETSFILYNEEKIYHLYKLLHNQKQNKKPIKF